MPEQGKRTIVVTGGSRGIGRAICLSLAKPNTRIYFNYFPEDPAAAETEKRIVAAGGIAKSECVDVASEKAVSDFINNIIKEAGQIDVLVNNAGIIRDSFLVRMKAKDWDDVLNINLKGAFYCTKIVAKNMMKRRKGCIINISSVSGVIGNPGQANYAASKAGLIGLTKTAAKELAPRGITVNAVAPGFIETDMTALLPEDVKETMLGRVPLGRAGKPEDVAGVVAFLASEQAAYINGASIPVDGGRIKTAF
jgi:3-oxoacyl-[acyl-carrier protein] reductase